MNLVSTRDPKATTYSYTDVLLAGLASDGGLFVPEQYPKVTIEELQSLQGKAYIDIATLVKQRLVGGAIENEVVAKLVEAAYKPESFPEAKDGNITPVVAVQDGLYLQNLSLGPTAAFKDMAMQLLGQEMHYELGRRQESLRILGATSGDTGSAAEAAMKGLERITLFMLSPAQGMSDFQKAQMGSFSGDNIFNISINGRFDDCQDLVKGIKADPEFADLGAVNSINWGRISSQVPYYFSGYVQVAKSIGDPVDFVVPSGNFGNVLSGYIAKQMGLPIRRLIVATNENDVLNKLFTTGVYELTPAQVTSSPSMDISKASNYERLVYDVLGKDAEQTAAYMAAFAESGRVDLKDFGVAVEAFAGLGFRSGVSSHGKRLKAIQETYETSGVIIDPHTADGVAVSAEYFDPAESLPMINLMTALPVKFEHTINEALGFIPERPAHFADLENYLAPENFTTMEIDSDALKTFFKNNSK